LLAHAVCTTDEEHSKALIADGAAWGQGMVVMQDRQHWLAAAVQIMPSDQRINVQILRKFARGDPQILTFGKKGTCFPCPRAPMASVCLLLHGWGLLGMGQVPAYLLLAVLVYILSVDNMEPPKLAEEHLPCGRVAGDTGRSAQS
jgi:hypothetical protein